MMLRSRTAILAAITTLISVAALAAGGAESPSPAPLHAGSSIQPGGPAIRTADPLTPTVCCTTSHVWAGLDVTAGNGYFTSVYDAWTEPAATCSSGNQYSVFWVGLDGDGSSTTVEQTGSEADCQGSTPSYRAWWEMYPVPLMYFSNPVRPGDTMTGSVTYANGSFTLTLSDASLGWTSTIHAAQPTAARSSAEVIAEAPTVSGTVAPLTNFGTAQFGIAYVNGHKITSYSPTIINMIDSNGLYKATITETELGNFSARWLRST